MLDRIRRIFEKDGWDAVVAWCAEPDDVCTKAKRYETAAIVARKKRNQAKKRDTKKAWEARREEAHGRANENLKRCNGLEIISREQWGARPPRSKSGMTSTSAGMFVHHTVAGSPIDRKGEEAEMRNLQQIGFARGFADISYSFIVSRSGRVYEGRGRGVAGAHTIGFNSTAYGVASMGNFENLQPTEAQVRAYAALRKHLGVASKPLRPHRAVSDTACPGRHLVPKLGQM